MFGTEAATIWAALREHRRRNCSGGSLGGIPGEGNVIVAATAWEVLRVSLRER